MADVVNDAQDSPSRGTDWEVVSLTASAYAASPGPKGFEPADELNGTELMGSEPGTDAMFMSRHFLFPQKEHENLPTTDCSEIHNETTDLGLDYDDKDKYGTKRTGEDVWKRKSFDDLQGIQLFEKEKGLYVDDVEFRESKMLHGMTLMGKDQVMYGDEQKGDGTKRTGQDGWKSNSGDDLQGIQFFKKENSVSVDDSEFRENKALDGMTMMGKDQVMYGAPEFGAFDGEANVSQSVNYDYSTDIPVVDKISDKNQAIPIDSTNNSKSTEDGNIFGSDTRESWWKRDALSIYSHVKEANKFWSVVVAAAVVGLVIWGHRWRRDNMQLQQLKLQSFMNNQRMSEMDGSVSRFKDVLVSSTQSGSFLRGGDASTHLGV